MKNKNIKVILKYEILFMMWYIIIYFVILFWCKKIILGKFFKNNILRLLSRVKVYFKNINVF